MTELPALSLFEDALTSGCRYEKELPPAHRVVYIVHGSAQIGGESFGADSAWQGSGPLQIEAGENGVSLWRWELTMPGTTAAIPAGAGVASHRKLCAALDTLPDGPILMRGDSVAFPPGGCAYAHVHQGPGIRCLIDGAIRIDTHGASTSYGPGGAWFEAGPVPVFAQAATDRPSRFIRVMLLPAELKGKSSIRYVDPADADKPKTQTYKVYVDEPIS